MHAYDFRMTYEEALMYIEKNEKPERFEKYNTELFQYALAANSITYIQRTISNERLKKPQNVNDVAEVIKLLTERGILLKEFAKKEVCDMTVAQFSRDDILKYGAREEGREEGRQETIRIMLKKGRTPEEIADFCDFDIEEIRTVENMIKERV